MACLHGSSVQNWPPCWIGAAMDDQTISAAVLPPLMRPGGELSTEAVAALCAHPNFAQAMRAVLTDNVRLYRGNRILNYVGYDRGRLVVALLALYLHVSRRPDDPTSGLTAQSLSSASSLPPTPMTPCRRGGQYGSRSPSWRGGSRSPASMSGGCCAMPKPRGSSSEPETRRTRSPCCRHCRARSGIPPRSYSCSLPTAHAPPWRRSARKIRARTLGSRRTGKAIGLTV
jgi:hypothetical protein